MGRPTCYEHLNELTWIGNRLISRNRTKVKEWLLQRKKRLHNIRKTKQTFKIIYTLDPYTDIPLLKRC